MKIIQHLNSLFEVDSVTFSTAEYSGPRIEGVRIKLFAYNSESDLHCELYVESCEEDKWKTCLVSNDAQSVKGNEKVFDINVRQFTNFRFVVKVPGPTREEILEIRVFEIPMKVSNDVPYADRVKI